MGTAMVAATAALSACGKDDTNVCVYGPPPQEEQESVSFIGSGNTVSPFADPSAAEEFNPSTEINEDVYGPPEYWE